MRLSQMRESTVLDGLADGTVAEKSVPGTFRPKVAETPPIIISLAGILKMLTGLDPTKAAGPDTIKAIVRRSLTDQVASLLQIIFKKSLDSGQIPSDWKKTIVTPLFKKGVTNMTLQTIAQSH